MIGWDIWIVLLFIHDIKKYLDCVAMIGWDIWIVLLFIHDIKKYLDCVAMIYVYI